MAVGTFRGGLPVEVTGFVGRSEELAEVGRLLERARLVTVVGAGGVGKTRVALRVARSVAARYPGGVCLVELSGLHDPELLPGTVGLALGLPEQSVRSQLETVLDYLRGRELLLVLDTCEHLVDACAMFADTVLREAPGVTVLATSRQPLDVPGEHTYPVPPLPVPEPYGASGGGSVEGSAVELFAQRAAAVCPGFQITAANHDQVLALCRRLDGIPLAIELATVRLRALSLDQLLDRLEDRFRLLAGGRRTALPRHQTLRTAIDWSHELCTPAERLLWARLSVFAGPFDLATAEHVCADDVLPRAEVMEPLIGLVDKSLVLRDGDGGQYRMLDTIREYGAENLAGFDDADALRGRHVDRHLAEVRFFDENFTDDAQADRYHALRGKHDGLRASLQYALALPGRQRDAAALAARLWGYWQISGLLTEGRYWLTKALDRFPEPCSERAELLTVRAYLTTFGSDPVAAAADLNEAIPMADALGDLRVGARARVYLHLVAVFGGDPDRAVALSAEAREKLAATGDVVGLSQLDTQDGHLYHMTGDHFRALDFCERGLRRLGAGSRERWIRGYLLYVSSVAHYRKGDHAAAAERARAALHCKFALGDRIGIAYCLETFVLLAVSTDRHARAAWLLGAADPLWERAGSRFSGTAAMNELHRSAETKVRASLPPGRYEELHSLGARTAIEQVVEAAINDADPPALVPSARAQETPTALDALTRREREVAALVAEGLSNREIAGRLFISKRTADAHVEHILSKLGISSRVLIAGLLEAARHR
ncbi:helix-turn-helix transcriptional regulator [Actinocorallia longicatena]|uniref:LuxR C-terminal-related transcriptional regulator n=1 Tax=Actinocorallia longicatena TaxID=111803 RepID=A0ABP6QBP8_9ACTN